MPATTLQAIRDTIGVVKTLRLLDHNSDGVEDAAIVAHVLSAADTELRTVLGRAYSREELVDRGGEDLANLATAVAVQHAYLARQELKDDKGNTQWQAQYEEAVEKLNAAASGRERLDRDASGRAYAQNAAGYVPTSEPFFTNGTGDF